MLVAVLITYKVTAARMEKKMRKKQKGQCSKVNANYNYSQSSLIRSLPFSCQTVLQEM